MAATVIFWTADLRVTASTRGASSLVVANPGPVVLAHSQGGSGRLRDCAADGADESSSAIIRGFDVPSAGLLADPLVQQQKLRVVNRRRARCSQIAVRRDR